MGRMGNNLCLDESSYARRRLRAVEMRDTILLVVTSSLTALLGLMWLLAGVAKLRSPMLLADTRAIVGGPAWLSMMIVRTLPFIEIALAALLLTRQYVHEAARISVGLLVSFTIVLGVAYFRRALAGLPPGFDCGCFGRAGNNRRVTKGAPREPKLKEQADIGAGTVMRPLIFAVLAWVVAFA
jgi:hypothetical protein